MRRGFLHFLTLAALIIPSFSCELACAQSDKEREQEAFRVGTHVFRRILHDHDITPVTGWEGLNDPEHTIVILHGRNHAFLETLPGGLRQFVERGGAVLLATDVATANQDVWSLTGFQVGDQHVRGWATNPGPQEKRRAPDQALFLKLPECVIPQPTETRDPPLFYKRALPGLPTKPLQVATNCPSFLYQAARDPLPRRIHVLARYPEGCWYGHYRYLREPNGEQPAFAVCTELRQGRMLLLADHSVFINEMMCQEKAGNLDFAYNVVQWLQGENGQRTKALFLEDGEIATQFDIPIKQIKIPLRELERRLVGQVEETLAEISDAHRRDNRLNDLFLDRMTDTVDPYTSSSSSNGFYQATAVMLALGLVGYGLTRLIRASHTFEPSLPPFWRAQSKVAPTPIVLEQRQEAMQRENNYVDVARPLAQEWFAQLPSAPKDPSAREPVVTMTSKSSTEQQLVRLAKQLWHLAYDARPPRVTRQRLEFLMARLPQLTRAVSQGKVRIEFGS